MVPDSTKTPAPVLLRPKPVPDTTPDRVNCVPETSAVLSASMVTAPDRLLVPVEVASVPPLSVTVDDVVSAVTLAVPPDTFVAVVAVAALPVVL